MVIIEKKNSKDANKEVDESVSNNGMETCLYHVSYVIMTIQKWF